MRVSQEHVTHPDTAFRFLSLELRAFGGPRHRHDEVELTWVVRGRGVRYVGDSAEPFEDGDLVLQTAPCPFLELADHRCSIYEDRPAACREYPHTDRKHMAAILPLTERNAHVCPAVAEIALRIAGVT